MNSKVEGVLLSDEEIKSIINQEKFTGLDEEVFKRTGMRIYHTTTEDSHTAVAKAQLKKVVEWGNEVCVDDAHHPRFQCMLRHCCLTCWQSLLKEIE